MVTLTNLPDAPWIRDAELNGPPEPDPVYCPVCGEDCSEIYFDKTGNVVGCDYCISKQDAGEWADEEAEKAREIEADRKCDERRLGDDW